MHGHQIWVFSNLHLRAGFHAVRQPSSRGKEELQTCWWRPELQFHINDPAFLNCWNWYCPLKSKYWWLTNIIFLNWSLTNLTFLNWSVINVDFAIQTVSVSGLGYLSTCTQQTSWALSCPARASSLTSPPSTMLRSAEFQIVASMLEEPTSILVNKFPISIASILSASNCLRNRVTQFYTLRYSFRKHFPLPKSIQPQIAWGTKWHNLESFPRFADF